MKVFKGYKYRIYPTSKQINILNKQFGCSRFVWNHFLDLRSSVYKEEKKTISGFECKHMLVDLKKEYSWLREPNSQSLQESVLNLEKAYRRFFKGLGGYPRFKKRANHQSISIPQSFSIDNTKLFIPKLKTGIRIKLHREVKGIMKTLTISKTPSGKYYASISCKTDIEPLPKTNKQIGIDLGLTDFAVLSTKERIENPKILRESQRKLTKLQRQLDRKQHPRYKGDKTKKSNNYKKSRIKVARLYDEITNRRKDFLHKLSKRLINENQVISLETLNVKGMVKNHHLAKSISDVGWKMFSDMLEYKAGWYGRTVKKIPMFYPSSKTCSVCGYIKSDLQLKDREWICPKCNTIHDRDINASVNINAIGQDMPELTPVERTASVTPILSMKQVVSMKQEALASAKMHGILIP